MGKKSRKKTKTQAGRHPDYRGLESNRLQPSLRQKLPQRRIWALLVIVIAAFASYWNTLSNGFVHDDKQEILQNPLVRDLSQVSRILTSPAWAFRTSEDKTVSSNYYRPLQYLTYAVLYNFLGPAPLGYHLVKLCLHVAVCLLWFWCLLRLCCNEEIAFVASVLFAVHPANTEAVAWISGITDVSCALFFVLALGLYLSYRQAPSFVRSLGYSIAFFLGLFAKETMATFVLVVLAYEYIQAGRPFTGQRLLRACTPLFVGLAGYLALRIYAIGAFTHTGQVRYNFLNAFQVILNQVVLLSDYVATFVAPVSLNAYRLFDPVLTLLDYRVGIAASILTGLVFLPYLSGLRGSSERRLVWFGLLWFVSGLLPVLVFLKRIGENVMAERYLYLPALGLCLVVSVLFTKFRMRFGTTSYVALALLISLLCWKSLDRNRSWHDDAVFYETALQASPSSATLLNNLATVYSSQTRYQQAIPLLEQAASIQPTATILNNLANAYAATGSSNLAESTYRRVLGSFPSDGAACSGLADLYFAQQRFKEAVEMYQKAVAIKPSDVRARFNLADAYLMEQRFEEAERVYQGLLTTYPQEADRARRGLESVRISRNALKPPSNPTGAGKS